MTTASKSLPDVFTHDVRDHNMTIHQDDGMHRHLRFQRDDTNALWFDIVTWPGHLAIQGDMGCYVFSRTPDMFSFFGGDGRIHPQYWGEKLQGHSGFRSFSIDEYQEQLTEWVREGWDEYQESLSDETLTLETLLAELEEEVFAWAAETNELDCRERAEMFFKDHKGLGIADEDIWECSFEAYEYHYLWSCYAVQWAIAQYRAHKAASALAENV